MSYTIAFSMVSHNSHFATQDHINDCKTQVHVNVFLFVETLGFTYTVQTVNQGKKPIKFQLLV